MKGEFFMLTFFYGNYFLMLTNWNQFHFEQGKLFYIVNIDTVNTKDIRKEIVNAQKNKSVFYYKVKCSIYESGILELLPQKRGQLGNSGPLFYGCVAQTLCWFSSWKWILTTKLYNFKSRVWIKSIYKRDYKFDLI